MDLDVHTYIVHISHFPDQAKYQEVQKLRSVILDPFDALGHLMSVQ